MANARDCRRKDALSERQYQQQLLSPPRSEGETEAPKAMTEDQRQFAAQNHNLIYAFLHEKGWAVDEYYDIAAFGFLQSVIRYLTKPELRSYTFSTIAWRSMGRSINSYRRAEARRTDAEQRYVATVQPAEKDLFSEMEINLLLHDLAARSTPEQYELAAMRLQGYSIAETARAQGMSPSRVRRLLRELFRVYLQLYHT